MTELAQYTLEILERNGQLPPRPEELEGIDLKVEVEGQWPRQMAVATGFETWPMLADLEVMLMKSSRNRILLPDEGLLWVNRIASTSESPHGLGSMGACLLLPVGPEYCVVWFDWGVYRRSSSGKIHEMSEDEELDFGATAILVSERLTYYKEGAADWCIRCAQHAWNVQQADSGWIPIPGLDTPHGIKWDAMKPRLMGIPPRPHIERVVRRRQHRGNEEHWAKDANELYRDIVAELDNQYAGILQGLNEGR